MYRYPGPGFRGIGENSAESSYYKWVDQHNTFGLGEDVPMSTGNLNDGLFAFTDGRMIVLRVAYPIGFHAQGFGGRIDDPNRVEGTRAVGRERRPDTLAHRGREGHGAVRRPFPVEAGPAGEAGAQP